MPLPLAKKIFRTLCIIVTAHSISVSTTYAQAIIKTEVENNYQQIIYKAEDLAKQPYQEAEKTVPEELKSIDYQQYRSIRFLGDKALWKDESNFEVQLFHPGFLYKKPVKINEIMTDNISSIPFSVDLFRYDGQAPQISHVIQSALDFSGFRVHYPLNTDKYKDELIVFQGASYFRPLGPGLQYGASARGLAIDTAESSGEEFPHFTEFWLEKPSAKENTMKIYALLDSPSATGAYRFELLPGFPTKVKVRADLFFRKSVNKVGISALTSMFFYGENRVSHYDDFRPEIHDSDGLLVATETNEWIWRPLSNPSQLHVSSFVLQNPKGFGLLQRDKKFSSYEDMEAKYHARPSIWIKPTGKPWGKGRVELVEIPTSDETNDNIVAYWVPEKELTVGEQHTFEYDLTIVDKPSNTMLGQVVQTRIGWAGFPGQENPPSKKERLFVIDFSDWPENNFPEKFKLEAKLKNSSGNISDLQTALLPDNKTWRASFKLAPEGNIPVDMSLALHLNGKQLTETWSYVWYPDSIKE